MSELARPEVILVDAPRLCDVVSLLSAEQAPNDYGDFAEDLGLANRVLKSELRSGLEQGLSHLAPFAARCNLEGAPAIFHDRRGYANWWLDSVNMEHNDILRSDQARMVALLQAHPELLLVTNGADVPYARVTGAAVEQRDDQTAAELVAYSGTVPLGRLTDANIACDVSHFPSLDMQRYVEQNLSSDILKGNEREL